MTSDARLEIEVLEYWYCGAGRGRGASADALCIRDALGLPYLPGRSLKGLLRDAVRRCPVLTEASLGISRSQLVETLFGSAGFRLRPEQAEPEHVERTHAGALAVTDARLPAAVLATFANLAERQRDPLRAPLFAQLAQTAVDHARGAANAGSLRTLEVAVPVTLEAIIECAPLPEQLATTDWREVLRSALPLVGAIGAHRSRGLGRARFTLANGSADG